MRARRAFRIPAGNAGNGKAGKGTRSSLDRPQTKWRPALLPASTVPRSVGPAREGETAFPREVPAEALRPRSVPQVPSQEYCYSGSGPCGSRAQPCGRLRFPGGSLHSPSCGIEIRFPIGRPRSEASRSSFRETFRPGASGSAGPLKESGFGFGLRRRLALLPSGCPDLASTGFRPKTSAALRGAVTGSVSPFPEGPRPATGRTLAPESDSRLMLNRGLGLWITGISGITWVKRSGACQLPGLRP